jgi:O-antigen/teichoic acid export membrane protein
LIDPAVPPTRSSFLRDSTLTLVTRLLVLASSIFANIVIARALGPELKGTYSLLLLVVSIGALATVCGLPSAIVYFGARDRRELPYQAGNAIVASIVFGLAGSLGVLGSTRLPAAGAFLARNGVALDAVQALALLVPLIQWNTIVPEVLRARGEIGRYNALLLAHAAAGAAFVAALLLAGGWLLRGAIVAWVAAEVFGAALAAVWVFRDRGAIRFDRRRFARAVRFGLRLHWGNLAQFLNYRLDVLIIAWLLSPLQVGLYTTATVVAERLWILPHSIRTVLLQRVAEIGGDSPLAGSITARATRLTGALLGVGCLILALIARPFMTVLFGAPYAPGAAALALLMPGVIALGFGKLLSAHLTAAGHPAATSWASIAALGATVVLDLVLVPRLGIAGAAIASSVAYGLSTAIVAVVFLRTTGLTLRDITVADRADLAILSAAARRNFRRPWGTSAA